MKTLSHRTPDGRVVRCQQHAADTPGRPGDARPRHFVPFLAACESVLPDLPVQGQARLGYFIFLLGAADRLWVRERLDDREFPDFTADLLRRSGVDAAAARTIATSLPQLREITVANAMLAEGAQAMDMWLDGSGGNPLLRLPQLLRRWQAGDTLP